MSSNSYCPTRLDDDAALRLVCLPHAGGGSAMFHRWRTALPSGVEVVPICLPGREARSGERPHTDWQALVPEIADAITPCVERPLALLGHSMGAWLAFELARELRRRGWPSPRVLVATASRAPHRQESSRPLHPLPDDEFLSELDRRFDGVPPAVRDNDELLRLLLPTLRADIELVERYHYEEQPPLESDILAIGGTDDRAVSATDLADWGRHTARRFSARLVPGGHFFLFRGVGGVGRDGDTGRESLPVVRMIGQHLERYMEKPPGPQPS